MDCIRLNEKWPKGYMRLGAAYLEIEEGWQALDAFESALKVDPEHPELYSAGIEKAKELAKDQKKPAHLVQGQKAEAKAEAATPADKGPKVVDTSPVIGIDLGTTYSCVGVWENGRATIIANELGNRITPSAVAFTETERLVGDAAKNQASSNPENTIFEIKRIIGQRYTAAGVLKDIKHFPYTVMAGENDKPMVEVDFKGEKNTYTPEQLSAMVLSNMKKVAEDHLGHEVPFAHHAIVHLIILQPTPTPNPNPNLSPLICNACSGAPRCHHGPGIFQRLSAYCHQERWYHRWT